MGRSLEKLPNLKTASRLRARSKDATGNPELLLKPPLRTKSAVFLILGMSNGVPHKCKDVGLFLDDFAHRLARAVSGLGFNSNQNRIRASLRSLQCGGELERVTRHNSIVMIPRGY